MPSINPPAGGYNSGLSAYNFTESSMRRWRAAVMRGQTSGTPARIFCPGDSITQGVASTPQRLNNWPYRLRNLLAADGRLGTVGEGMIIGGGQVQASYDERWTNPGGWARVGDFGAQKWQAPPGTAALQLALPTCDTIQIHYQWIGGFTGNFSYSVDGGGSTTISQSGPQYTTTAAFTVSAGTHSLSILPHPTAGYCLITGVSYWTAGARKNTEVITGGAYSGWHAGGWTSANGVDLQIGSIGADLMLPLIGRNDANSANGVTPTQFKANLAYVIDSQRALGKEIILVSPPPSANVIYNQEAAIFSALYALADEKDVCLIDLKRRFGPNWYLSPYSFSTDDIHPNDGGSYAVAQTVANVLLTA